MNIIAIIPCFNVKYKILSVIKKSLDHFDFLICIDDNCPQNSGDFILKKIKSKKIVVIKHTQNRGVGGALKTGFKYALKLKPNVIVKLDGDNQIDPNEAKKISNYLIKNNLDYVVGSRFKFKKNSKNVPLFRWYGNRILSSISKIASGLYHIDDFLNGLIAIKFSKLKKLKIDDMKEDFLFETDLLFTVGEKKFKIESHPMKIKYFKTNSNFKPSKEFMKFMIFNFKGFFIRIYKEYIIQNFKFGTFFLLLSLLFLINSINQSINLSSFFNVEFFFGVFFILLFFITDISEKKGQ